jgi:adenylosuccinate synthase
MKLDVIIGLQWGDEGKGKIVDLMAPQYNVIARYQGGPNAGHSLSFGNTKHVLHNIPSGVFHSKVMNIIGNGVLIDPVVFRNECESLIRLGADIRNTLKISKKSHLILPTHRIIDAVYEQSKGTAKIGSTLKGIGPAYSDKSARNGLRAGEIFNSFFRQKYDELVAFHCRILRSFDYEYRPGPEEDEWFAAVDYMKEFQFIHSEYLLNSYLDKNQKVLAEGAQGTLLDIDFGTYPFVTSSSVTSAGACTGLGLAPSRIGNVYGVFKAYCTRVGSGPFPTEIHGETGELIRKTGGEYGATTGRPRRCGWLDIVALKYAVMINGVNFVIMTKADVLDDFDEIYACVAYNYNGRNVDSIPFEFDENIQPVYKNFKGWKTITGNCTQPGQLPENLIAYIRFIEHETGVPIYIVSVGQDRNQTVRLLNIG